MSRLWADDFHQGLLLHDFLPKFRLSAKTIMNSRCVVTQSLYQPLKLATYLTIFGSIEISNYIELLEYVLVYLYLHIYLLMYSSVHEYIYLSIRLFVYLDLFGLSIYLLLSL